MWNLRILLTALSEIMAEMRSTTIQRYTKKHASEHSRIKLGRGGGGASRSTRKRLIVFFLPILRYLFQLQLAKNH